MKENTKNKCDLLMANTDKLSKEFKWGETLMNIAAALVFSGADREIAGDRDAQRADRAGAFA